MQWWTKCDQEIPGIGGGVGRWFPKDDQNEIKILEFEIAFLKKIKIFILLKLTHYLAHGNLHFTQRKQRKNKEKSIKKNFKLYATSKKRWSCTMIISDHTIFIRMVGKSDGCALWWSIAVATLNNLSFNLFLAQVFNKTTRLLLTTITRYVAVRIASIIVHIILVRSDRYKVSYWLLE